MLWLLLCLCVTASMGSEIRCDHPQCIDIEDFHNGWRNFQVEGHNITLGYKNDLNFWSFEGFYLDCKGWQVLDSMAMPRFTRELQVAAVELLRCPLPANNTSVIAALAALNVTVLSSNNELDLLLRYLPSEPPLAQQHLRGFERLTWLAVYASEDNQHEPKPGFLVGLQNLRTLTLSGVKTPTIELHNLPHSVDLFEQTNEDMETLPKTLSKTLLALPGLRYLTLEHSSQPYYYNDYKTLKLGHDQIRQQKKNDSPSLERLVISEWKEKKLAPFEQCDGLRYFKLDKTNVEELPDRWVAACPYLEELTVLEAWSLRSLPANLLDNAGALKNLTIEARLTWLPDGWLQGAPNLRHLDLCLNKLRTISSGWFSGPALQFLSLKGNKLDNAALTTLATLKSLTILELNSNKFTGYICDEQDYAPLLAQLRVLDLAYNDVNVCSDWRRRFPQLDHLHHERH